jgi:hypothetical protein
MPSNAGILKRPEEECTPPQPQPMVPSSVTADEEQVRRRR